MKSTGTTSGRSSVRLPRCPSSPDDQRRSSRTRSRAVVFRSPRVIQLGTIKRRSIRRPCARYATCLERSLSDAANGNESDPSTCAPGSSRRLYRLRSGCGNARRNARGDAEPLLHGGRFPSSIWHRDGRRPSDGRAYVPYINTIATFLTRRCFEQIAIDVCLHRLPVRLIASGGGAVYAPLGPTHMAVEDLAILRTLPEMTICAPSRCRRNATLDGRES